MTCTPSYKAGPPPFYRALLTVAKSPVGLTALVQLKQNGPKNTTCPPGMTRTHTQSAGRNGNVSSSPMIRTL